jgi:fructose-bisphosphate aldolase, class I
MLSGLQRRLALFTQNKCNFILPIDHGLTLGPLDGLHPISRLDALCRLPHLRGIVAHKGIVSRLIGRGAIPGGVGVVCHLNGMVKLDSSSDEKVLLTTVKMAVQHGADAVSIQLNFNGKNSKENLVLLSHVVEQASDFGLPVLVMLYLTDSVLGETYVKHIRKLLRLCCELAVDMVKIAFPACVDDIPRVLEGLTSDIHVFFAGGTVNDNAQTIQLIETAVSSGARGVCMGRNIFQNTQYSELIETIGALCE